MSQNQPAKQRRFRDKNQKRKNNATSQSIQQAITAPEAMMLDITAPANPTQTQQTETTVSTHLSTVRFDSLSGRVDARLIQAIPFPLMSEVQAATIDPALTGGDVLAQAKTGTGKTIAFLLPTTNRLLRESTTSSKGISCLIMSPTRELALQIEKEAAMLLQHVDNNVMGVQHVVGGTNMKTEERNLATKRCDILVATPGRLLDHLENSPGVAAKFNTLKVYILDEADRMLDMGFRRELTKINQFLPNRQSVPRQTLLFSATLPSGVREVANLSKDARFINTLSEEEANTHAHVPQQSLLAPSMSDMLPMTLALLSEELTANPTTTKVIVFLPTARAAGLAAEVFQSRAITSLLPQHFTISEVHSRKSQAARVRATQEFASTQRGILFSSDVAARGVDFPGVTAVYQVGLPASPEQYIHRIGRTGRAGAQGHGVILLGQFESFFLQKREMRELPITVHPGLTPQSSTQAYDAVRQALLTDVSDESKAQAYQASLGYYKAEMKTLKWNATDLVKTINDYAKNGLLYKGGTSDVAPPLLAKTVGKMGIRGTPGLNVVKELPGSGNGNGNAGGGRGGQKGGQQGGQQSGPARQAGVPHVNVNGNAGSVGTNGGSGGVGGRGRNNQPRDGGKRKHESSVASEAGIANGRQPRKSKPAAGLPS